MNIEEEIECEDCLEAIKKGYTMCGECSVPWCQCGARGPCDCGPIADNE